MSTVSFFRFVHRKKCRYIIQWLPATCLKVSATKVRELLVSCVFTLRIFSPHFLLSLSDDGSLWKKVPCRPTQAPLLETAILSLKNTLLNYIGFSSSRIWGYSNVHCSACLSKKLARLSFFCYLDRRFAASRTLLAPQRRLLRLAWPHALTLNKEHSLPWTLL